MTLHVFAGLRDLVGARTLDVDLPEPATVGDVLAALETTALAGLPPRSFLVSVNREYAPAESPVTRGDEVALIPPVSGG